MADPRSPFHSFRPPLMAAIAVVASLATTLGCGAASGVAALRPGHPRLIVNDTTWRDVAARSKTDPLLEAVVHRIEAGARATLDQPPATYHLVGRRLLATSREVERRILALAAAYRLTNDPAFLRRADAEMLAVAAFPDWHPPHFLDVGELTAAMALGYDWLYADLSPATRQVVRDAIVTKGLRPALDAKASVNSWQRTDNNWNQVCFGGLVLGALAVGDDEPEIANRILERARGQMVHGLSAYAPDGVYPEGPGYWSYGTSYSALTFAALETALHTDWGLPQSPGFLASAGVYLQTTGPTGMVFNYSDGGENGALQPALFWFARRLHDSGLVATQLEMLRRAEKARRPTGLGGEGQRLFPLVAVWWPQEAAPRVPALPLAWHGRGTNSLAIFRSSWSDPNALYLALKGGSASLNHAHMDAGSFVFERDGVRWARDLGMQDYESLESKHIDLWNKRQESQRWQVFRLNNRSHNTLTIDGALQRVSGSARIVAFSDRPGAEGAVLDLTSVYAGQAARVTRGFRVLGGRTVLVQDELAGLKPGADVRWSMTTAASVRINGDHAVLQENGRTLDVRVLAPAGAALTVIPADPPKDGYDAPNPNRRFLQLHITAPPAGTETIAIVLGSDGGSSPPVRPIADWEALRTSGAANRSPSN